MLLGMVGFFTFILFLSSLPPLCCWNCCLFSLFYLVGTVYLAFYLGGRVYMIKKLFVVPDYLCHFGLAVSVGITVDKGLYGSRNRNPDLAGLLLVMVGAINGCLELSSLSG
jgi:hypothetical protein